MRAVFIGCVESSSLLLSEIFSTNKITIVGVITKKQSSINSDFVDLTSIAKKNNAPVFYFENKINESEMLNWISDLKPDVIFCLGWSHLLPSALLQIPKNGIIGYHPAELPANRGRHPIVWALALGLERTASTFFLIDEGADSGDIVSQTIVKIDLSDNAQSLYDKLMKEARVQVRTICKELSENSLPKISQNHALANYWRKRSDLDGKIDWRMNSLAIYNLIRALSAPYPGAYTHYQNDKIILWKSEILHDKISAFIEPGKVISHDTCSFTVKTYDGAVKILSFDGKIPLEGDYL